MFSKLLCGSPCLKVFVILIVIEDMQSFMEPADPFFWYALSRFTVWCVYEY